MWIASSDLELVRLAAGRETAFAAAHSTLAEALEKILRAELLRLGWILEKTHDLDRLLESLKARRLDLIDQVDPLCDALADVYFSERYPGFDVDDPDWPKLHSQLSRVTQLLDVVQARIPGSQQTA